MIPDSDRPQPEDAGYTYNFQFRHGDKVLVREIQRPGVVETLMWDSQGPQYRVVYWNDSNRKAEWVYGWELEKRT